MGPTRHRHNALTRGGEWRKLLKLHPNNLILSNNSLVRYSLLLHGLNCDVIITNPFPEIAIFDLKGQERTHPVSFASCPEWRRAVFVFYMFFSTLCSTYSLLRPTCTLHRSSLSSFAAQHAQTFMPLFLPPLQQMRWGTYTAADKRRWMNAITHASNTRRAGKPMYYIKEPWI